MDEQSSRHAAIGREFLTWLYFQSDSNAGRVEAGGELFELWLDRRVILEDDSIEPPSCVSFSGDTFTSDDLKTAIKSGKKIREARFRLEKLENTWCFSLRADRLEVASLKIDLPGAEDIDERFHGRIIAISALNDFLDTCFASFLDTVLSKKWKTGGCKEFQAWLDASVA
jgi:recombination associated protein RdgC